MTSSLRQRQHPLINQLANHIEAIWQRYLTLAPYTIPADLGYIEGSLEDERLVIENLCHNTPQFRKLHMELAQVGRGIDILHCVMFPEPVYDLPIFGVDLVGKRNGAISAAIVDLSPVSADRSLPAAYTAPLADLPPASFSQPRDLPDWGYIFSNHCLFVRPVGPAEEAQFLQRVQGVLTAHCQIASASQPLTDPAAQAQVINGQLNYCTQQRQNDKTRRILERSFGPKWADRYMTTMLFDLAPIVSTQGVEPQNERSKAEPQTGSHPDLAPAT